MITFVYIFGAVTAVAFLALIADGARRVHIARCRLLREACADLEALSDLIDHDDPEVLINALYKTGSEGRAA